MYTTAHNHVRAIVRYASRVLWSMVCGLWSVVYGAMLYDVYVICYLLAINDQPDACSMDAPGAPSQAHCTLPCDTIYYMSYLTCKDGGQLSTLSPDPKRRATLNQWRAR